MSKKLKIVIALAVGIVILSLGSGAIVMASDRHDNHDYRNNNHGTVNGTVGNGLYSAVATAISA